VSGEQTPAPAVFDECVGESKLEIERVRAGDSFCVRLSRGNCGVAMEANLHVAVLEDFILGSFFFALPISSARVVISHNELVSV